MAGQGDQPVGRPLCQGPWIRRKTGYVSGNPVAKAGAGREEGLRGQPAWQGQAGLWSVSASGTQSGFLCETGLAGKP